MDRDHEGPSGTSHCKDIALALREVEATGGFQAKEGHNPTIFKQDSSGGCVESRL